MKVTAKEVRECETEDSKTIVLVLEYTHRGKKGRILVRDYDDSTYEYVLAQLKKEVSKHYKLTNGSL